MLKRKADQRASRLLPVALITILVFIIGALPAMMNLLVDPYQVFTKHMRSTRLNDIAEKKHYPLWKLAKYRRDAHDTIVLGDSRARSLRDKYWHELGLNNALNLAYGGGTIPEIYSTFEIIKDDRSIRNLVIGIQLRSFDEDHKQGMNRVPEAAHLIRNRIEYLKNWSVFNTSVELWQAENEAELEQLSNAIPSIATNAYAADLGEEGKVPLDRLLEPEVCFGCDLPENLVSLNRRGSFGRYRGLEGYGHGYSAWTNAIEEIDWDHLAALYATDPVVQPLPEKHLRQVTKNGKADWRGFQFSEKYWAYIQEIGTWAKDNDVNLIFVIPPTVSQMQETITKNGLGKLNHMFRLKLARLGTVVDFDFDSELTQNPGYFNDAYHFNAKIARSLVTEIAALLEGHGDFKSKNRKPGRLIECAGTSVPGKSIKEITSDVVLVEARNCRVWKEIQ